MFAQTLLLAAGAENISLACSWSWLAGSWKGLARLKHLKTMTRRIQGIEAPSNFRIYPTSVALARSADNFSYYHLHIRSMQRR